MTGISIAKHIYARLTESEPLRALIGTRLYPVAADQGTAMPYVTYHRTALATEYTYDGAGTDTVSVSFRIVAGGYQAATDIAEEIRATLEGVRAAYGESEVRDAELVNSVDAYDVDIDAYVLTLDMRFRTN